MSSSRLTTNGGHNGDSPNKHRCVVSYSRYFGVNREWHASAHPTPLLRSHAAGALIVAQSHSWECQRCKSRPEIALGSSKSPEQRASVITASACELYMCNHWFIFTSPSVVQNPQNQDTESRGSTDQSLSGSSQSRAFGLDGGTLCELSDKLFLPIPTGLVYAIMCTALKS